MNSDERYGYEDSLAGDTGGIPSKERVRQVCKQLEIGWLEGLNMKFYYWRRRHKAVWYVGTCVFWSLVITTLLILALAV